MQICGGLGTCFSAELFLSVVRVAHRWCNQRWGVRVVCPICHSSLPSRQPLWDGRLLPAPPQVSCPLPGSGEHPWTPGAHVSSILAFVKSGLTSVTPGTQIRLRVRTLLMFSQQQLQWTHLYYEVFWSTSKVHFVSQMLVISFLWAVLLHSESLRIEFCIFK